MPRVFVLALVILSLFFFQTAAATDATQTCSDIKKESSCMTAKDGKTGDPCAWCSSAAVASSCNTQTDAQGLPSSIFECKYQTTSGFLANSNSTLLGYNPSSAVSYGNSHCATNSEWLCAEFVARSLNAGGEFPGVTDYGNYNGYNLRYVPDLHKALIKYGWKQSSSGYNCGSSGQVLIYGNDDHAALAIGNCKLDQHNPSRCGTSSDWGTNVVMYK